jgi:DNA-binding CsgD family transcriptional regulator
VLYQHAFMVPTLLWYCGEAIVERPQLADVVTLLESIRLAPAVDGTMSGAWTRELRARARVAAGDEPDVEELRVAAGIYRGAQVDNPNVGPWRSHLASVIAPTDPDEASRLVAEELELARRLRMPRAEGIALRAAGLLEGGEAGIALLRESLERLGHAPSALERARTLVELGSALRRANQRSAARESLSEGLDLAHRCGADRLADHAMAELRASGAKPRRRPHSGIEALTPSEERVAHMAASGLSNREIAQTLFVTAKTVENQLGRVYGKLSVAGRDELAAALEQPES